MSTLLERSKKAKGGAGLVVAPFAQVNLLPNEIVQARSLKNLKKLLGVALLGVVAILLAAVAGVTVMEKSAQGDLNQATERTEELRAEEAKYAEVPVVINALDTIKSARALGFSTEVLWKPHLDAITAVMPAGVSISSFSLTGSTPMAAEPTIANPLQTPSVNTITFVMRSLTLPDSADLMVALDSIYGFGDAWVSNAAVAQAEDGTVYYDIAASVQVRSSAYANRFTGEVTE